MKNIKKKILIRDLTTNLYYVGAVGDDEGKRLYFSSIYEAEFFDSTAAAEQRMKDEINLFASEADGLIVAELVEVYNFEATGATARKNR